MRTLQRVVAVLLLTIPAITLLSGGVIAAQDVEEVDGTADFRAPPFLGNGTFSDTLVTGEAVWYAVIYTNSSPYRIEVSVPGVDLEEDEIEVEVQFISPTLGAVQADSSLLEGEARLTGGGPDTNTWFIQIALNTSGRLGVEHEVVFSVEGVEDGGIDSCADNPSCTLDEELAELDGELAEVQASIEAIENSDGDDDGDSALQEEAERLEGQIADAESATAAAEQSVRVAQDEEASALEQIAMMCAPDSDCDVPPASGSGSALALIIGGVILVGGLGLLAVRFFAS